MRGNIVVPVALRRRVKHVQQIFRSLISAASLTYQQKLGLLRRQFVQFRRRVRLLAGRLQRHDFRLLTCSLPYSSVCIVTTLILLRNRDSRFGFGLTIPPASTHSSRTVGKPSL